jgi:hypothetical protein
MQKAAQGLPSGPDPPWLPLLSERERAEYAAARPDATAFQKRRLTQPQRRAAYRAAPDPDGARARALERQQAAYNVYSRLAARGRRLLQKARQGRPLDREPPWLRWLSDAERAKYRAAWPDAMTFQNTGLANPRRRAEYLAAPDPTGQRAKRLERLQAARNTYSRLARLGRRRMKKAEPGQAQEQVLPPSKRLPQAGDRDDAIGKRSDYEL